VVAGVEMHSYPRNLIGMQCKYINPRNPLKLLRQRHCILFYFPIQLANVFTLT
jgi:hypothetical protein